MEARASLLIEANCTGKRFPAFMKCGRYTSDGWIFAFPEPYIRKFPFPQSYPATEITWTFREFKVNSKRPLINENGGVIERWELYLSSWNGTPQTIPDFCYRLKDNTRDVQVFYDGSEKKQRKSMLGVLITETSSKLGYSTTNSRRGIQTCSQKT